MFLFSADPLSLSNVIQYCSAHLNGEVDDFKVPRHFSLLLVDFDHSEQPSTYSTEWRPTKTVAQRDRVKGACTLRRLPTDG